MPAADPFQLVVDTQIKPKPKTLQPFQLVVDTQIKPKAETLQPFQLVVDTQRKSNILDGKRRLEISLNC
jgi:hypothetical protein